MRIISGKWKGKKLTSPQGKDIVRPTSDRSKEALFSILDNFLFQKSLSWAQTTFLDVFAGSGAIGIEALSRGSSFVYFIENNSLSLKSILSNLPSTENTRIFKTNALTAPKGNPCTFVFLDPPYHQNLLIPTLLHLKEKGWIDSNTLVILEMDANESPSFDDWTLVMERTYTRNKFIFLTKN